MQPSTPSHCPPCKSPIAAAAPGGLCPACTLEKAATVSHTASGGRRSAPPSIAEIAPHFPDLEILEWLGAGGMAAVYKARQPLIDRFVALKILSHDLAGDPAFVERFNREAKVLARLNHPNIVTVFDFGTAGPFCYLLMEYVDGVNLRQAMRTGGFKPAEALALVQDVCAALQFAHEAGILHRDIKPENILIDSKGRVKIADFGIAKLLGEDASLDVTLTLRGSILGSPHYMAPEQIETPGDVDQRADIYSLGVVFYEMLTGELPIGRFNLPSEKAAMDRRIDDIVLRTLAKERAARYQSAAEVGTRVAAVANHPQAPAVASDDAGTARFSLLSALLSGMSLILIVVFFSTWTSNMQAPQPASAAAIAESMALKLIPALVMLVPGLGCALAGFIFGARALGEVRVSGGRKSGSGFAIFAVVAWPIVFMSIMANFFFRTNFTNSSSFSIGLLLTNLLLVIPMLLASFGLIQGLHRWACGVEKPDGQRHFPGLSRRLLAVFALAFLGPVLTTVSPLVFGSGPNSYEPHSMMISEEIRMAMSPEDHANLHEVSPKMEFAISLRPGTRATFRLVQRGAKGDSTITTIGQVNAKLQETVTIKVGGFEADGSENSTGPELSAAIWSRNGHFKASTKTGLEGWKFFDAPEGELVFNPGESREFELAKRKSEAGGNMEVLHFLVETTPLP